VSCATADEEEILDEEQRTEERLNDLHGRLSSTQDPKEEDKQHNGALFRAGEGEVENISSFREGGSTKSSARHLEGSLFGSTWGRSRSNPWVPGDASGVSTKGERISSAEIRAG